MIFLLIERHRVNSLAKALHYNVKTLSPRILQEHYELVYVLGRTKDIIRELIDSNIKARFVLPLLSEPLFKMIFGEEAIQEKKLGIVYLSESVLENLIALDNNRYPTKNTGYYNIADLFELNNVDINIDALIDANNELSKVDLLIDHTNVRISLREILAIAIQRIILKEIENEPALSSKYYVTNSDFFFDGLTEFLLLARKYYDKEDVRQFLLDEFSDIL